MRTANVFRNDTGYDWKDDIEVYPEFDQDNHLFNNDVIYHELTDVELIAAQS
jgi:hypothetical protein